MNVGERMKKRRKELGLSAESVAARIGVSPATIYRYESAGISNMGVDKVKPIADVLTTSPDYLLGWTDDPMVLSVEKDSMDETNSVGVEGLNWKGNSGAMRLAERKPTVESDSGLSDEQRYLIDRIKNATPKQAEKIYQIVNILLQEDE